MQTRNMLIYSSRGLAIAMITIAVAGVMTTLAEGAALLIGADLTLSILWVTMMASSVVALRRPTVRHPDGYAVDLSRDGTAVLFWLIVGMALLVAGGFAISGGLVLFGILLCFGGAVAAGLWLAELHAPISGRSGRDERG